MTTTSTQIPDRSDGPAFARYISEVTAAFAEGKEVEYSERGRNKWRRLKTLPPAWSWNFDDYRVQPPPPAPQWEPWTFETSPPVLKVIRKEDNMKCVAYSYPENVWVDLSLSTPGYSVSYADLLCDFEALDGTPLGVKVEGDTWPKWYVNNDAVKVIFREEENGAVFAKWLDDKNDKFDIQAISDLSECTHITADEAARLLEGKV